MTPLLIFLSQLCVRGKPLRLSSLTDKPFFSLRECGGDHSGKQSLLSTIGSDVSRQQSMFKASRCGWEYVQMVERCLSWEATAIDRRKATAEWEDIPKFKGL